MASPVFNKKIRRKHRQWRHHCLDLDRILFDEMIAVTLIYSEKNGWHLACRSADGVYIPVKWIVKNWHHLSVCPLCNASLSCINEVTIT